MKIALCSSYVPFVQGGARNIVEWLGAMLRAAGHQIENVYVPQADDPHTLFQQMAAFRWIDLSAADRIICFRPQAHLIPHPHKILWFIHHIRSFYDLWDSKYRNFPDDSEHRAIRDALHAADSAALREAKHIFTNSKVVSERLQKFNHIDSEVLYPPVFQSERFYSAAVNDEIVYICRMEHHKRQHLLIEALRHTRTPVKLRLCGASSGAEYPQQLRRRIESRGLANRVAFEPYWISEEEKIDRLAHCLAAAYLPVDEDSYGYPTIEASHAAKAILTTHDAGGVLEWVDHERNGLIVAPTPKALGQAMDRLYQHKEKTLAMGQQAHARLSELEISWPHVLDRLLA